MKYLYLLLLSMFMALVPYSVQGQEEKWEGGLIVGPSNFLGDLTEAKSFWTKGVNLGFGLFVKRNFSSNIGLRLGLNRLTLSADETKFDDLGHQARAFNFKNSLTEINLLLEWDILGHKRYNGRGGFKSIFSPYLFVGGAAGFSSPGTNYGTQELSPNVIADKTAVEGGVTSIAIPFGAGVRYDLNRKWVLGLEMGVRPTFEDNLDGVSASGNADDNDWYLFGGVTIATRFGSKDADGDGIADVDDNCPTVPGISSLKGCPDADLDGITDAKDACPQIAGDELFNGCPDTDGDGVADNLDNCPTDAGDRRFRGCPDTDGDEIADPVDDCPTVAGVRNLNGCPDTDLDGVTDLEDDCPELAGPIEKKGCPDVDGDGFIDPEDKCPNKAGTAQYGGCPDTDGDGLGDSDDKCPTNAGPVSNGGCPLISAEDQATLDLAMSNVRFETSKEILLPTSNTILNEIAEIMGRYPSYDLTIKGYTDSIGNDVSNQNLSERRAAICYAYLVDKGVDAARMSHSGHGETNPIASNDSSSGRAKNRRVQFTLVQK